MLKMISFRKRNVKYKKKTRFFQQIINVELKDPYLLL